MWSPWRWSDEWPPASARYRRRWRCCRAAAPSPHWSAACLEEHRDPRPGKLLHPAASLLPPAPCHRTATVRKVRKFNSTAVCGADTAHISTHGDVLSHKLGNFVIGWGDNNVECHVSRAVFAIWHRDGEMVGGGFQSLVSGLHVVYMTVNDVCVRKGSLGENKSYNYCIHAFDGSYLNVMLLYSCKASLSFLKSAMQIKCMTTTNNNNKIITW